MNDNLAAITADGLARRGLHRTQSTSVIEPPWSHDHGVMLLNLSWFEVFDQPWQGQGLVYLFGTDSAKWFLTLS